VELRANFQPQTHFYASEIVFGVDVFDYLMQCLLVPADVVGGGGV